MTNAQANQRAVATEQPTPAVYNMQLEHYRTERAVVGVGVVFEARPLGPVKQLT